MSFAAFLPYVIVMAGVTYLIRMLPLTLIRKPISSRFLRSFLAYVPYAVLGAMTLPEALHATTSIWTAIPGVIVAAVMAWRGKSLIAVAAAACLAVAAAQGIMMLL